MEGAYLLGARDEASSSAFDVEAARLAGVSVAVQDEASAKDDEAAAEEDDASAEVDGAAEEAQDFCSGVGSSSMSSSSSFSGRGRSSEC